MIKTWPSPGKLNLFLYITGQRTNGYHCLQTVFQLIEYGDNIEYFITNNGKIRLFNLVTGTKIIKHDNLIIRAAHLLHRYCKLYKKNIGVDIFLHKVLPIGAGLGGGSSNAATTLMVLNQKWKCYLNKRVLMNLGLMLGADIPVFIHGYSSFSEGIGEKLKSLCIPKRWYLIIKPPIYINTSRVFSKYVLSHIYSPYRSMGKLLRIPFSNDLKSIVTQIFPDIKIYFSYLSQYTLAYLTGTGSCIFSEFFNEQQALKVQGYLPSWIKTIITPGINTSPVHYLMSKYIN